MSPRLPRSSEQRPNTAGARRRTNRLPTGDEAPPVALGGELVHEPGLPHPWVTYPGHYGTFHTFADQPEGPWRFCVCAVPALANLAEIEAAGPAHKHDIVPRWTLHIPEVHLPAEPADLRVDVDTVGRDNAPVEPPVVARYSSGNHTGRYAAQMEKVLADPTSPGFFVEGACHRCNVRTPALRWAHEMYETGFNQYHGWYTQQAALRAGFLTFGSITQGIASRADPDLVELRVRAAPKFNVLPDDAAKAARR